MADVASVLFNLMAANETGPAIASAKAGMAELGVEAEEVGTKSKVAAEESKGAFGGMGGLVEVAGIAALGEGMKGAVEAAEKANQIYAMTDQVLKSTGDKAGLTADQVKKLSDSLGEQAGVAGVTVQTGLNLALRSQAVQSAMKNGTTTAAGFTQQMLDLAASQNQGKVTSDGVTSAATTLSKALGNPFAATKALKAAGVELTLQQQDQLKAWKKSGDVADAQKMILDTVTTATKGAADANVTAGQKLSAQFADLKVSIGEKLLPVLETFETDIMKVINFVEAHSTIFGFLAAVLGTVAGAVLLVVGATKAWAIAGEILDAVLEANPIGLVIVAIAALVAGIIYAYDHFTTFRNGVNDVWSVIKTVFGWVKSNWPLLLGILTGPFGLAIALIVTHFHEIKSGIENFVSDAGSWLLQAGKDVINGLVKGIEDMAMAPINAVKGIAGDVKNAFSSVLGIFSPSRVFAEQGNFLMQGLANGVVAGAPAAIAAVADVATKISGSAAGSLTVKSGKSVSSSKVLRIEIDFTGAATDDMVKALRKSIRLKGKGNVQAYLGSAS